MPTGASAAITLLVAAMSIPSSWPFSPNTASRTSAISKDSMTAPNLRVIGQLRAGNAFKSNVTNP